MCRTATPAHAYIYPSDVYTHIHPDDKAYSYGNSECRGDGCSYGAGHDRSHARRHTNTYSDSYSD